MENLMTRKQAAEYLGFSPATLARYAWLGKGPEFMKVGRSVRYKLSELQRWVNSNGEARKENQSEPRQWVSLGQRHRFNGVGYFKETDVLLAMQRLNVRCTCYERDPSIQRVF